MPNVTAIPRWFGDEEVTQIVDTVGTTETTYTFPKSQEFFKITNTGYANILVSVGSFVDVIVSPGNSWSREVSSVDIKLKASNGVQSFELKGINYREQLMQLMGSNVSQVHTFHNASAAVGNGTAFVNDKGYTSLIVDITSKNGNTARSISFFGNMGGGGTFLPLTGSSYTNPIKVDVGTTLANERWLVDITGMETVEIRLTSITSGDITVRGRGTV